jgi:hypothetical protein
MSPPQSTRYLYPNYDYENFEFSSPVNPWSPQSKYSADFDKIKCLEFTLTPGKTLFIPAYWWYSIKFNNNTSISCFYYRTYMNNIAILPYISMHALQIQNIKRNTVKKASINDINHEIITPIDSREVLHNFDTDNIDKQNNYIDNENNYIDNQDNHIDNSNSGTNINELPEPANSDSNFGTEIS